MQHDAAPRLTTGQEFGPLSPSSASSASVGWARSTKPTTGNSGGTWPIKVLPRVFTDDPERLARFEREARMLAALDHPNIARIYGFEEASWRPCAHPRVRRWRNPCEPHCARTNPPRARDPSGRANLRCARSGAWAGDHPPRFLETREHQSPFRRHRQGARFRPRQGAGSRRFERGRTQRFSDRDHAGD